MLEIPRNGKPILKIDTKFPASLALALLLLCFTGGYDWYAEGCQGHYLGG